MLQERQGPCFRVGSCLVSSCASVLFHFVSQMFHLKIHHPFPFVSADECCVSIATALETVVVCHKCGEL